MYNLILDIDSYKASHYWMYPKGLEQVFSYIAPRYINGEENKELLKNILFLIDRSFIIDNLARPIIMDDIDQAEEILKQHGLPFNREGWEYILDKHGGYLPIKIWTLDEGTVVKPGIPVAIVYNTDRNLPWLTSYVETALLRSIWYPTTVGTVSLAVKNILEKYLLESSENVYETLPFMLHDFGARGVSSYQSAAIGGMAHLVNFMGTDTVPAIQYVKKYFDDEDSYMPAYSVDATEHSVMTQYGPVGTTHAYAGVHDDFIAGLWREANKQGKPILSVVIDSYDWKATVDSLVNTIQSSADIKTKLVLRPDSGDIVEVLEYIINRLSVRRNSLGYRVLPDNVGILWGDGVDHIQISKVLEELVTVRKIAASNFVFGMGGALLQKVNRDTLGFAQKASFSVYNENVGIGICKRTSGKESYSGVIGTKFIDKARTVMVKYYTIQEFEDDTDMKCIFDNGSVSSEFLNTSFESVRIRASSSMNELKTGY